MTIPAGSKLGPYEVIAPIGAGGMGEVYKARDTRLERTVAVKVLPAAVSSSPEVRQRFEREAKMISQLSHPHICALYDVGQEGGVEYLVMEYLEGQTLTERLARGALPLDQVLRYGIEIADALAPGLPEGHKALGLAYQAKGAYRGALEAYRRTIELAPNHYSAMINLAAVLTFLGRQDESLSWSERAFELAPTVATAAVVTGAARAGLDDTSRAEDLFHRALKLQPDLAQPHVQLIRLYLRQGRDREALEKAREAVGIPSSDPALVTTAEAELLAGDPGRARQLFERFLPFARGVRLSRAVSAGVETYLAYLDLQSGRRSEADALLSESLEIDRRELEGGNQDWAVRFDMACVHTLRGEKDEAFRWLDRAVEAGWRGWPLGTRTPLLDSLRSDPRLGGIEKRLANLVSEMRRRVGLS